MREKLASVEWFRVLEWFTVLDFWEENFIFLSFGNIFQRKNKPEWLCNIERTEKRERQKEIEWETEKERDTKKKEKQKENRTYFCVIECLVSENGGKKIVRGREREEKRERMECEENLFQKMCFFSQIDSAAIKRSAPKVLKFRTEGKTCGSFEYVDFFPLSLSLYSLFHPLLFSSFSFLLSFSLFLWEEESGSRLWYNPYEKFMKSSRRELGKKKS